MPLVDINHYLLLANDLEKSKRFYCDVFGLQEMHRPNFPFPGAWLGRGDKIWVHMAPRDVPNWEIYYKGTSTKSARDNTGVVDHIAFAADDPDEFRERFSKLSLDWWARALPDSNLFQIFVRDPDGLTLELNFFDLATMPTWAENYNEMPRVN
jgi:catechol 2,3-dioxygenase-like lactoylglutathione lyase family enzyme